MSDGTLNPVRLLHTNQYDEIQAQTVAKIGHAEGVSAFRERQVDVFSIGVLELNCCAPTR